MNTNLFKLFLVILMIGGSFLVPSCIEKTTEQNKIIVHSIELELVKDSRSTSTINIQYSMAFDPGNVLTDDPYYYNVHKSHVGYSFVEGYNYYIHEIDTLHYVLK